MRRITLDTFRKLDRAHDAMARAAMPRIAATDSAPIDTPILPAMPARRTWRVPMMAPLTYTMQEVARA